MVSASSWAMIKVDYRRIIRLIYGCEWSHMVLERDTTYIATVSSFVSPRTRPEATGGTALHVRLLRHGHGVVDQCLKTDE